MTLLCGMLAHEFLHVVDRTIELYKAYRSGQKEIKEQVDPRESDRIGSIEGCQLRSSYPRARDTDSFSAMPSSRRRHT